jgi:ubiquinone biosynthesis protein UbiJ
MGRSLCCALILPLALMSSPATAQDVPGLETCTAEKQMERRTGCLQSNDDFLAQRLSKLARETEARLAASGRELAAARAEIATLKSAMEKLNGELAQLKAKVEAAGKR